MFDELVTPRFFLQQISAADQEFIFRGLSDPQVIPFYGVSYDSFESAKAQMEFYQLLQKEKTGNWWKIVEKETNTSIGACGINNYSSEHQSAEIGYWLLPSAWKKGIMPEVIPVMIKYLFSTWNLHRIEAVIEEGNLASCKLSEKLGFRYEGTKRECEIKNSQRISLHIYSILKTEFRQKELH